MAVSVMLLVTMVFHSLVSSCAEQTCQWMKGEHTEDYDGVDLAQTQTSLLQTRMQVSKHVDRVDYASYSVNLDDPPRERWKHIAAILKPNITSSMLKMKNKITSAFTPGRLQEWWQASNIYPDQLAEMEGIADVLAHPDLDAKDLIFNQGLLNEMLAPRQGANLGCSGLVVKQPDGSILHGRNVDYVLPYDATSITFEVTYFRNGQPVFITLGTFVGAFTGMRFGGWSIEQNSRFNTDHGEILANAKSGALATPFAVRKLLEETPDYKTAIAKLENMRFMSSQYFILAGTSGDEGAVYTVDANVTKALPYETTQTLETSLGRWFLVQTNDDIWNKPNDLRRPKAIADLNSIGEGKVNETVLENIMTQLPLFIPFKTLYTWLLNPAKGTHKFIKHVANMREQGVAQKSPIELMPAKERDCDNCGAAVQLQRP